MSDSQQQVFTSWKEIASYLGKSVRTVQRWEQELELPVQRPHARAKGTVRANQKDLDDWVERTWLQRSPKQDARVVSDGQGSVNETIETSRKLRVQGKEILDQVLASIHELAESCRKLHWSEAQKPAQRKANAAKG
jgi:hypothetical protein